VFKSLPVNWFHVKRRPLTEPSTAEKRPRSVRSCQSAAAAVRGREKGHRSIKPGGWAMTATEAPAVPVVCCVQCGDPSSEHTGPGGMCRAMVRGLECKCSHLVEAKR
jgi:hypothetical protein